MSLWKKISIWVLPSIVILCGIFLLFFENYQEVAEPPSPDWSREFQIGTTASLKEIHYSEEPGDHFALSFLTPSGIEKKVYNRQFELIHEQSYDVPVDKYTDFYLDGNQLVYSDYYSLYNGITKDKITDVDGFYPVEDHVFYRSENEIFELNTETLEADQVMTLNSEKTNVMIHSNQDQIQIVTNTIDQAGNHLTFYTWNEGTIEEKGQADFTVRTSEEVKDIQPLLSKDSYTLLIKTNQKQSISGKPVEHLYFSNQRIGEQPDLKKVSIPDPYEDRELTEISDVEVQETTEGLTLLFKAFGRTDTMYGDPYQFNIYESTIAADGAKSIKRLSNTPTSSLEPLRISSNTIGWVDIAGENKNRVYISSGDPAIIEKADQMTMPVFLQTLGKTIAMLAFSILAIFVTLMWYIWPLLFVFGLMFTGSRALDKDRSWVFYTGAGLYLAAAVLFKDQLFSQQLLARAPEYLSFTGSSIFYVLGFAILSLILLKFSPKARKWSPLIQLSYFIGFHVVCITIFFGPYLL
ncbi:hypothetical protein EQV77_12215 [Halobacillus fulvus]|nr:hypothetical protein EQV77_12215 [Halobacillus fulvus]